MFQVSKKNIKAVLPIGGIDFLTPAEVDVKLGLDGLVQVKVVNTLLMDLASAGEIRRARSQLRYQALTPWERRGMRYQRTRKEVILRGCMWPVDSGGGRFYIACVCSSCAFARSLVKGG